MHNVCDGLLLEVGRDIILYLLYCTYIAYNSTYRIYYNSTNNIIPADCIESEL